MARLVKAPTVRRCEQPSTRHATSAEAYTTCDTPLDERGECSEASDHVEL